ncbi:hypothetical protein BM221_009340 [Beauveria bassiana]|uniref:Uncharacterized protein n=1 Tax=Beauveria bassiana TaxID=176275 RepID=A0A2N6NB57_BEABA|nr:hypothetical protein BM221_009340 [Beauveria bassiana]
MVPITKNPAAGLSVLRLRFNPSVQPFFLYRKGNFSMAPSVDPNKTAGGKENEFLDDISAEGGFRQPSTFDDTREERDY